MHPAIANLRREIESDAGPLSPDELLILEQLHSVGDIPWVAATLQDQVRYPYAPGLLASAGHALGLPNLAASALANALLPAARFPA